MRSIGDSITDMRWTADRGEGYQDYVIERIGMIPRFYLASNLTAYSRRLTGECNSARIGEYSNATQEILSPLRGVLN